MAAISTTIAAIGVAASVAGTATAYVGAQKQADAAEEAEKLRKRQMDLEADRQRRQIARQAAVARGQALSNATVQGAGAGSGAQGGMSGIVGEGALATRDVTTNQQIGAGIFNANAQYAQAGSMVAAGQGLSSLGGSLVKNSGTIGQIGAYYSGGRLRQ